MDFFNRKRVKELERQNKELRDLLDDKIQKEDIELDETFKKLNEQTAKLDEEYEDLKKRYEELFGPSSSKGE